MRALKLLPALMAVFACAPVRGPSTPAPVDDGRRLVAKHGAVASASALASEAGVEMLRAGGNAVDAAVATAFAIGVAEPQMSGVGGSGTALVWMAGEGKAYDLDFYAAQNALSFRGRTSGPYPPGDLRVIGVPGNVAGLLALHQRFGRLPRERVMAPAIRLARDGVPVGDVLGTMILADSAKLHRSPGGWALFWPNGRPLPVGSVLRNPELAATLGAIAEGGVDAFYKGELGRRVVAAMNAGGHPGTEADLAAYTPRWKRPLCAEFLGLAVLSAAPPQTGMQVLESLQLLGRFDLPALGLPTRSAKAFHVVTSALRVGMADADQNDDPAWATVPAAGVVSPAFAAVRASLVGGESVPDSIREESAARFDTLPPTNGCRRYEPYGPAPAPPAAPATSMPATERGAAGGETTHMSVVDADGNAVALTQTNSSVFGSGAWVAGFFLNDSGSRFSEQAAAAPPTPWRTRVTTIAPTLVMDGGRVRMVVGAPGGGRIPTEIVQVMAYVLAYGMDPLDAVRMPRIYPSERSRRVQVEHGFSPALLTEVRRLGYELVPPTPEYARLYMIVRGGDGWIAVSDPRHDGNPRGY